jgi:hypothetical protein
LWLIFVPTAILFLKGHDPGAPLGEIIDAAAFIGPDRTRFIAEIYSMGAHISVLMT